MRRSGLTSIMAFAMLVAACSDTSAVGSASSADPAPLGPTVLTTNNDGDDRADLTTVPPSSLPTNVPMPTVAPTLPAPPPEEITVLAAGNLGRCDAASVRVSEAIAAETGLIFAVGDLSTDGTQASVEECFLAAFEAELARIYIVPGDREGLAADQAAFTDLIARTATAPVNERTWFVAALGSWQIIGLDSRCDDIGGCGPESEQFQWLDAVLRDQPADCRAVMWHDARYTSALAENDATDMGALLGRLDGAGADLLITGSPSNYERLGPIRPNGAWAVEGERGMRHFNIGGGSNARFDEPHAGSALRDSTDGYVRFVFGPEGYTWEFVATSDSETEPDTGSGTC